MILKKIFGEIKKSAVKIWDFKKSNTDKYKILKIALVCFFPVLLAFTTELNHTQSVFALFSRIGNNPNAFIFSVLIISFVFAGILFITRSITFSIFINWVAFYTFSWVEYFKFIASGTHFVVTDMAMIGNASDMTKFTTVNILLIFNLNLFIMIAYTVLVFFLNIKIKFKFAKSFLIGFACIVIFADFIAFPAFTLKVYSFFDIENSESVNSFTDNDKFNDMNFIPYFVSSATNLFTYAIKEPENYSEESVKSILKPGDTPSESEFELDKVNIIYILSESFADFRIFESENQNGKLNWVYENFDIMRNEGFGGICVVPTFGGYTARSEFELMLGLPLKSIGNPALPHNKLKYENPENIAAIPDFYRQNGYNTTYIHPFSRTFYNRDEIYSKYGFDNMIFDDNIKSYLPPSNNRIKYFRKYIDDTTVFECIINRIKNSDKPEYIMATTMQNHVPYSESDPEIEHDESGVCIKIDDEFKYYLEGIAETDRAVGYLKEQLEYLGGEGKKCVVIFIGDHFPFFISDTNKYKELKINSKNCDALYEQGYFIWANFDLDPGFDFKNTELGSREKISLFYLPNLIAQIQGLPKTPIINTVLGEINNSPVYSQFAGTSGPEKEARKNEVLDMLTYDLILDKKYALK